MALPCVTAVSADELGRASGIRALCGQWAARQSSGLRPAARNATYPAPVRKALAVEHAIPAGRGRRSTADTLGEAGRQFMPGGRRARSSAPVAPREHQDACREKRPPEAVNAHFVLLH